MISLTGLGFRACDGITRREMLRVGGLGALGLSLPGLLERASASENPPGGRGFGFGRAKACLVIYLFGGPSQIDTFDLKPDAPEAFRGEFRPIATTVPGITICEHLPRLSRRMDKLTVIRSMRHEHPRHGWGLYYMLTGRKHSRPDLDAPPTPDDFPGLGALVSKLHPGRPGLPTAVTLPRWNRFLDVPNDYAGEKGGILGAAFDPWLIQSEGDDLAFTMQSLEVPVNVPVGRLSERRKLLEAVDRRIAGWGETAETFDALHRQAYHLVSSRKVRQALDVGQEPDRVRERYGRHPFGQGLLLARRLIEAGSTLVQVNWHNDGSDVKSPFWDTHQDNFNALRDRLLPPLDESLSALLDDLHTRGLLDETLVLVMGEFGRTPRIGQVIMNDATDANGRDHWPHAYTVVAAGAGLKGGTAYGETDDRAAYVIDRPVSPPDLHATVLHALGVDPNAEITDRQGRRLPASLGRPVIDLL